MAGRMYAQRLFTAADYDGDAVGGGDEFDESDIWGGYGGGEQRKGDVLQRHKHVPLAPPASRKKGASAAVASPSTASLPLGIPDWSKILRGEYNNNQRSGAQLYDEDEEEEGEVGSATVIIPPHELVMRRNKGTSSFSVYEGRGRTLKGRDLSRVRDAVWEQTGFQD